MRYDGKTDCAYFCVAAASTAMDADVKRTWTPILLAPAVQGISVIEHGRWYAEAIAPTGRTRRDKQQTIDSEHNIAFCTRRGRSSPFFKLQEKHSLCAIHHK